MPTMKKEYLNIYDKTPRDLFTKSHKDLVIQGEKWTEEIANSCSFVAALVATIIFVATFIAPSGNDQTKGMKSYLCSL